MSSTAKAARAENLGELSRQTRNRTSASAGRTTVPCAGPARFQERPGGVAWVCQVDPSTNGLVKGSGEASSCSRQSTHPRRASSGNFRLRSSFTSCSLSACVNSRGISAAPRCRFRQSNHRQARWHLPSPRAPGNLHIFQLGVTHQLTHGYWRATYLRRL